MVGSIGSGRAQVRRSGHSTRLPVDVAEIRFPSVCGYRIKWRIQATIGCKTRETLQHFGIFSMNFALEQKICRLPNLSPPPTSMLITLSGTIFISYLANIDLCRGDGGCFTWDWDIRKFAKTGPVSHQFCNRLQF